MQFINHYIFRSPLKPVKSTNDPAFSEALYLATPTLYGEYQKNLKNAINDPKEIKKLNVSLYKYKTRASNRCTPFGLFAGLSVGEWETKNEIVLNSNLKETLYRKTRLDMNVLYSLTQELVKLEFIKSHLKFYPNTSIYSIGNSYRYIEYYYNNNRRFHKINRVDFTTYLEHILDESKAGLTKQQLINLLINCGVNEQEGVDFIDEIISIQLLINQLEPTVTGIEYFDVLMNDLKEIYLLNKNSELNKIITLLGEVDKSIKVIDNDVINSISSYKEIYQQLKYFLPELSETNLFQTDLYKKTLTNSLNLNIQEELGRAIQFLNKITPPKNNSNLEEFKKKFYERYEDYEVPLLVALDTETGVGYPVKINTGINELVEDVFASDNSNTASDIKWDMLQSYLLKLINDCNKSNKKVIRVNEDDFKDINFLDTNLPHTMSVMFKVLDSVSNKIEITSIGGNSAINLLGRFANGNNELSKIVLGLAEFEQLQMPDRIIAEIVHLPESRTGNILSRPNFRAYEIPYLAKSSVPADYQIKVDDLTLKIKNNSIVLFDKRLNKEIIPRLGNAHNFSFNSLPVYHFLCDLQSQDFSKTSIGFNWGVLANQFNFLPRVEYSNTIISPARWRLNGNDLNGLKDKKKSDEEKHFIFFELKRRLDLPDKFLIVDFDNELLIDCNENIAIDTFIDLIKNKTEIIVAEYLFNSENAIIKDTDKNSYTNEFIAVILNEKNIKDYTSTIVSKTFTSKKFFSIGSEWLFYKIYCGPKIADYILAEKLKPITEILLKEGIIDKWFFIRYGDPDFHLRVRVHISNFQKYGEVLLLINSELEPLISLNVIAKIQTDTYKRELDRYGDNSIELVEQIFFNDSIFVTNMLSLLDAEGGSEIRWKIAIRSVDEFLCEFQLDIQQRYDLVEFLKDSFFKEHGGKKELKLILDNKFRTHRSKVEDVLNKSSDKQKDYYSIIELLNVRCKSNKAAITELLHIKENNKLQTSFEDLLASLLHMNLDRLFMGRNRTNEFVVYDLLFRYYKSVLVRLKNSAKKQIQ